MAITHSITRQWAGQNGNPINPPPTVFSGSEELNFSFSLAASTTNQQEALAFTKTLLQSIFIYTDGEAITIKTNSTGSPQDTINIPAGEPLIWDTTNPLACPFAGNVTTAYFTNAQTAATNVYVRCLTNG